jgi:hypothetical protein
MSMRKLSVMALLLTIPAMSQAQRGGGGGGGGTGYGKGMDTQGAKGADKLIKDMADSPSMSKDLQKVNPIELLLDKKKDLQLSDAEQKELKTLASAVKDATKPYFKTLDSVQREQKLGQKGEGLTTGQMMILRRESRDAQDSVLVNYKRAADEALTKLTEEHRQPATDLLKQAMEEQMEARRNSRGGRPPM